MKADYTDIKERISTPIRWYDSNGVPRYNEFSYNLSPDIYADEVCLLEIACQACDERFLVGMEHSCWSSGRTLAQAIKEDYIHYGDPPRHACVGDTMNCEDKKVLEYWHRVEHFKWGRVAELEKEL